MRDIFPGMLAVIDQGKYIKLYGGKEYTGFPIAATELDEIIDR
ncbi:MAG: hypothetical protein JETT_1357 [Candidatus Jettenia ecosi]|uniref:Uncharacterized protein n=1 Tax=Candidatus Jettenia ecosi TaxID=2494326 RepID=A0A533QC69_9BACT|nr:MAG: hypothetical protein JETT_1357 [Candidatus Jettenia ecosi]